MLLTLLGCGLQAGGISPFVGFHAGIVGHSVKSTFKDKASKEKFEKASKEDPKLSSPEGNAKSTNALFGLHAGLSKDICGDKAKAGVTIEVNRAVDSNLTLEGKDTQKTATSGLNLLGHALLNLPSKLFFGAEAGVGLQGFKVKDYDTQYAFTPMAGLIFGKFLTENCAAKLNVRYACGLTKEDSRDKLNKKPSNLSGTVGLSYFFV